MPPSHSCQTARSSLAATKALHREFATAYALANQTRDRADVERVHELRTKLDESMVEFGEVNKAITIPKLVPGIFSNWPSCLEELRVTELNEKFTRSNVEIGGKSEEELLAMLTNGGFKAREVAQSMMEHDDFKRSLRIPDSREPDYMKRQLKPREEVGLIHLSVADLGFSSGAVTDQIFARAVELGLELCPPEVGPQLRLQYTSQPLGESVYVGMKQVAVLGGGPYTFEVAHRLDGLSLTGASARPGGEWDLGHQFVFRLRKQT